MFRQAMHGAWQSSSDHCKRVTGTQVVVRSLHTDKKILLP